MDFQKRLIDFLAGENSVLDETDAAPLAQAIQAHVVTPWLRNAGIANPAALRELVAAVADLMLTAFDGGQTVNDPACVDAFALERLRAALAAVQREGGD